MKNIIKKFLAAFVIVMSCAFVCSPANAICAFIAEAWLDGETAERIYGARQDGKKFVVQYVGNDYPGQGHVSILTLPARIIGCDRMIEDGYEDMPESILFEDKPEPVLFSEMGGKYILRFSIDPDYDNNSRVCALPFINSPTCIILNEWLRGSGKLPCELQILGDASIPTIAAEVPFRQSFYAPSNIFVFVLDYFHTLG